MDQLLRDQGQLRFCFSGFCFSGFSEASDPDPTPDPGAVTAVVAWPLIFIKGKQAVLEPGTIFDAIVRSPVDVDVAELPPPSATTSTRKIKLTPDLVVEVLYDEMDPDKKLKELPLELRGEGALHPAAVIGVNGEAIADIQIRLVEESEGVSRGYVEFKPLSRHFAKGMNRLEVRAGEHRAEVLLEIEF